MIIKYKRLTVAKKSLCNPVTRYIEEEKHKMLLNPLGYDPIKDIDEINSRNRRKTDDPYIRATSKNR